MFCAKNNPKVAIFRQDPLSIKKDHSNLGAFYKPVSDMEQQSFCKNFGGYPRNDINVFLEAEDVKTAEALSAALIERHSDSVLDSDMSDADLILSVKSKYQQTPSELVRYYENMLEIRDSRLLSKQHEIDAEKTLKEKEALRASIKESLTNEERDRYLQAKREKQISKLIEDE